jgi:Amt family ammonium transporter
MRKFAGLALGVGALMFAGLMLLPSVAFGQEAAPATAPAEMMAAATQPAAEAPPVSAELFTVNNLWMMIATFLVFIMHLGFATVESGLCRAKNCVNILTKNTAIPLIGILLYAAFGFNLMYPNAFDAEKNMFQVGTFLGFGGFGIGTDDAGVTSAYNVGYTYWTDFLFQAMFAATAATIVSGAVAERVKFYPFLIFTVLFVGILYPITGSWQWGMGWLKTMEVPFYDFAGSSLVHSVGAWGALAGVILLGPRIGKYAADGSIRVIPGHSLPLATIGVFLLFLGWFGFNGGSVLSADPGLVSLVFVTTTLAGCAGGLAALLTSGVVGGKPDLSMALNGILAGLVGITAGADQMSPMSAIIIGLVAGVIVVLSVVALDKLRLDDPVGAISVHGVCGIWGTLAVGIFGKMAGMPQLISQLIGVAAIGATAFIFAFVVFIVLKVTMGIRVSATEEIEGLDLGEHGMKAYPDFTTDAMAESGFGMADVSDMKAVASHA